jgi:HK97 family phage major capsid protein
MAAPIHLARQRKADLDANIHALKSEARKLMDVPAKDRTPEQKARLDAIDTDLDAKAIELGETLAEIQRLERYQQTERESAGPHIEVGTDHATERPWGPVVAATLPKYRQDEARHLALGNFAIAVRAAAYGQVDPRLHAAATGAGTQTDSNLGFAVPMEVAPGIEREMYTSGEILSRVDARTISGNSIAYNLIDETSRADSSRGGGVLGYWVDEGTAPTASNTKLARIEMKLRKVGAFGAMTDELISDAVGLGGELESAFARELIFQIENKIYRGNGASAPLGFLNAACLVTVSKETGQSAATIVGSNITKMVARLPASSRNSPSTVWLANVDTTPSLAELVLPLGTGGVRYPYASVNDNGTVSLWGKPVIFVEYAETLGTVGDLALVDLSKYRLIRKGGVEQASSMHVYFTTGEQAFRAFYRVDGQPVPRAAVTPFKGSATQSPFVVLNTRS